MKILYNTIELFRGASTMDCNTVWARPLRRAMRFVTAALLIIASTAMAQDSILGTYTGHVDGIKNGNDAFELTISAIKDGKLSGTNLFNRGPSKCRQLFPLSGTVTPEGVVRIDSKEGVLPDCERTFDLKVIGTGELKGTLVGPKGTFRVMLVRQ